MSRAVSRPPIPAVPESAVEVITTAFRDICDRYPSALAMSAKKSGSNVTWRYAQYKEDVYQAAKAMMACGLNAKRSVAIIGFNCPEWYISAYGAIHAGGLFTGLYTTNSPEQCLYIVDHSDSQLAKFRIIRSQLTKVKKIVLMDDSKDPEEWAISWTDFLSLGSLTTDIELKSRISEITLDDVCTLIYTSGTTGTPKGVMITHRNISWVCKSVIGIFHFSSNDRAVSYLPLSHIAEQIAGMFLPIFVGGLITFATPDALKGGLVNTLREARPTVFFSVPRVWEKIESALKASGASRSGLSKAISMWAKKKGLAGSLLQLQNREPGVAFHFLQKTIFKKVKEALGFDQCKFFFTGAAPTSRSTLQYFMSLDIQIFELFGMSEVTGPTNTNFPGWHKIGSVGPVFGNARAKIFDDGEICLKGPFVCKGYWKDAEATAATIDSEGWLHTGDIGFIDDEGFVYITDRKKEIIITAGGENIAPTAVESKVKAVPGVGQCVIFGDRQKYVVALVVLDPDTLHKVAEEIGSPAKNMKDASMDAVFITHIEKGIEEANKTLAQVQTIKKFKILENEFAVEGTDAEMTATMKLRRHIIYKKYDKQIRDMYGADFAEK